MGSQQQRGPLRNGVCRPSPQAWEHELGAHASPLTHYPPRLAPLSHVVHHRPRPTAPAVHPVCPHPVPADPILGSPALFYKNGGANSVRSIALRARPLRTRQGHCGECCAIDQPHSALPFSPSYLLARSRRSLTSSDFISYATTLNPRGCCFTDQCLVLETTAGVRPATDLAGR
jgi:hypothetical protein